MIALEDLKDKTEQEVIEHLAFKYSGKEKYDTPTYEEIEQSEELLKDYNVLVAYESVGNWDCDSTLFSC